MIKKATPTQRPAKVNEAAQSGLHPRSLHHGRYDFQQLTASCPELKYFLRANPRGDKTIDFTDNKAVLCLNKALLSYYYNVNRWSLPAGYLCPAIPGRADYIHYLADLLATDHQGNVPMGADVRVLDIGTGANCIYPIIGSQAYGWKFTATEVDSVAFKSASNIVEENPCLEALVELIQQHDKQAVLTNAIGEHDKFAVTMCNPPFHSSMFKVEETNRRKNRNLGKGNTDKAKDGVNFNFGGQKNELCFPGGEVAFINKMARESVAFAEQVCWFSSLVSKDENVRPLQSRLMQLGAKRVEVVKMCQGQKVSRFIAWSYLTEKQRACWFLLS